MAVLLIIYIYTSRSLHKHTVKSVYILLQDNRIIRIIELSRYFVSVPNIHVCSAVDRFSAPHIIRIIRIFRFLTAVLEICQAAKRVILISCKFISAEHVCEVRCYLSYIVLRARQILIMDSFFTLAVEFGFANFNR